MDDLRFAVLGTGFWARYQLAAWREIAGARCVALYNRTRSKAAALGREFGIPAIYDDPETMLDLERPDFVDVISDAAVHAAHVRMAAARGIPVICQKPMATSLAEAAQMVAVCREAGVPLFVHENWRWQTPIRQLKRVLAEGAIGDPFRARIHFCSSFPIFDNQPFLRELEQFILTDIGSHILDAARFLFGEAASLVCQTRRIHTDIKGEDVATVMIRMLNGMAVVCEMSYASRTERERFPETYVFVEGSEGSAELGPDYWIRSTTTAGTSARRFPPPRHAWADPAYDLVHASIVPCCANLLAALRGEGPAETTGEDNFETVRLVFACYESARADQVIHPHNEFEHPRKSVPDNVSCEFREV